MIETSSRIRRQRTHAQRRTYKNDPIVEALCEVRYLPGTKPWQPLMPAEIYNRTKDSYDGDARQVAGIEQPNGPFGPGVFGETRLQLGNKPRTRLMSIAPQLFSAHALKPYEPGWTDFKPQILRSRAAFEEVTGCTHIVRIGLRYINRVELPVDGKLDDYFSALVYRSEYLPDQFRSFIDRREYVCEEPDSIMIVTVATVESTNPAITAVVLDVDAVWQRPQKPLPAGEFEQVLDNLRQIERDAFEGYITDKLRERFNAAT
jgi:uncharacterized protein (TIGR04255 family)